MRHSPTARAPRGRRLAAAVLALGAALTGCGGGGGADGDDPLHLWIMAGTNPDAGPYADELAAAFEERTGVPLDVQFVQWADAHGRITTAIAAGELPDVAEIGTTWAAEFGAAGALTDLTDRIDGAGLAGDLLPALAEAATLDGATYGMPWYAGTRALLYRADLLAEHGLQPPTTWDELRDVGLALREAEPDIIPFPVSGGSEYGVYPFVWGAGGEIAVRDGDTWTAAINRPEAVEGISFYTSLATEHGLSVAAAETWLETDQLGSFQRGESAMVVNGNWAVTTLLADDPAWADRLGAVPVPGRDGGISPSFVGGSLLGDFGSDRPDLAWRLIELMTTGDLAAAWADASGYFPGQRSLLDAVLREDDPLVAPFARQMTEGGAGAPATEAWGTVQGNQVVQHMLQEILSGAATPQEAADAAASAMDETFGR